MSQSIAGNDLAQTIIEQVQSDLKEIRSQYAALTSQPSSAAADTRVDLEHLAQRTHSIQTSFQASSPSLPRHDQKVLSEAITALAQSIAAARSTSQPRAKFSFKKRPFATPAAAATSKPPSTAAPTLRSPSPSHPDPLFSPTSSPTVRRPSFHSHSVILRHQRAEHIAPRITSPDPSTATLAHLDRCIVSLPTAQPLATAHVRDATSSLLLLGRVAGAVHLTALTDCVVLVAARQFRLHDSRDVKVYLACGSEPVIEDCERVGFARLPAALGWPDDGVQDRWDHVRDFSWLASGENPHWSRMGGEEASLAEEVWRNVVGAEDGGMAREELLRLARVRS